jgi:hypothetical protein
MVRLSEVAPSTATRNQLLRNFFMAGNLFAWALNACDEGHGRDARELRQ